MNVKQTARMDSAIENGAFIKSPQNEAQLIALLDRETIRHRAHAWVRWQEWHGEDCDYAEFALHRYLNGDW